MNANELDQAALNMRKDGFSQSKTTDCLRIGTNRIWIVISANQLNVLENHEMVCPVMINQDIDIKHNFF